MRQLSTATLAAAVALVFANAAQAAVTTTSNGGAMASFAGSPTVRGQVATAPAATSSSASSTGTSSSTGTTATAAQTGTTGVDVRAQQTQAATAVTHASGSTSSLGSFAGAASANSATTTGTGTTSGLGATGSTVYGGAFAANPSDFTTGIATNANGMTSTAPIYAASDIVGGASLVDTSVTAVDPATTQANRASFDRAIRAVAIDRKRIGRNGQLLQTIAPRTNADRSHEMPDDPLPASLTGTNSTIVR